MRVTAAFSRLLRLPGIWVRFMGDRDVRSKLVGLKPTHVWDVSQTAGDPVPEVLRPSRLHGQAPAGLWDGLADQITALGFELRLVSSAAAIGGANGLTDFLAREVSIRMDMDDAAQVKTLAQELSSAPGSRGMRSWVMPLWCTSRASRAVAD